MILDHATIVTKDLDTTYHFFRNVIGLQAGPRPSFRVRGYWLYASSRPVIHLTDATVPMPEGSTSPRIDHIGFRVENSAEWRALLDRLKTSGIRYDLTNNDVADECQITIVIAPGIVIEIVMSQRHRGID
jgi:catechol 2,3-dioxygenase-like lactoylglutathione lyase family enzyme